MPPAQQLLGALVGIDLLAAIAAATGGGAIGEGAWASITAACVSDRRGGGFDQGAPMPLAASGGGERQGGRVAKAVRLASRGEG